MSSLQAYSCKGVPCMSQLPRQLLSKTWCLITRAFPLWETSWWCLCDLYQHVMYVTEILVSHFYFQFPCHIQLAHTLAHTELAAIVHLTSIEEGLSPPLSSFATSENPTDMGPVLERLASGATSATNPYFLVHVIPSLWPLGCQQAILVSFSTWHPWIQNVGMDSTTHQQTIPDPIIPISKRLCQLLVAMLPPYFGSTLVTIEYWFNKVDNLEIPDSNQMDPDQHRHPSFNKRGEQLPMMLCTRQSHKERRCLPLTWWFPTHE
jgi:hypothetical protein